ncbi:MAG: GGDEF domain-containing protein [Lachnospiraceae bacterium]|nr:GGDEF domain-containing protein [Lachnospiraceae bacterium]
MLDKILGDQKRFINDNALFIVVFVAMSIISELVVFDYHIEVSIVFSLCAMVMILNIILLSVDYWKNLALLRFVKIVPYFLGLFFACCVPIDPMIFFVFAMTGMMYTYQMYMCYDYSEYYPKYILNILNLVVAVVAHIVRAQVYGAYSQQWLYIVIDAIYASLCFRMYRNNALGIALYEKRLGSKDDMIDRMRHEYNNLAFVQNRLVSLNEQLNDQKIEREKLYEKIKKTADENWLQYTINKYITGTLDANQIIHYTTESIKEAMSVSFCCVSLNYEFSDSNTIPYSMDDYIGKNFKSEFKSKVLEDELVSKEFDDKGMIVVNRVGREDWPYLFNYGIGSVLFIKLKDDMGLFAVGKTNFDCFTDNTYFYENVVSQLDTVLMNAQLYKRLDDMVKHDGLSKIYNRRYLSSELQSVLDNIDKYNNFAVAIMDIDDFKKVNDTYGHVFGDRVIVTCASLADRLSEKDDIIVARYGGEEFAIVFKNKEPEFVRESMEKLQRDIKEYEIYNEEIDRMVDFDVSIGVAMYPEIEDYKNILIYADRALYESKKNGKGRMTYYHENN